MWTPRTQCLLNGRTILGSLEVDASPMTFAQVLQSWRDDAEFRSFFTSQLCDAPFAAFRWETPPVTAANADRPFEYALIDSPGLAPNPDALAFAEYFRGKNAGEVVEFANLGNDAILIVPCPAAMSSAYGHLASFLRHGPETQRHSLWQTVGAAMLRRLGAKPVWLSTAGAGVSWLHVRLDDRPKYYSHSPYRVF